MSLFLFWFVHLDKAVKFGFITLRYPPLLLSLGYDFTSVLYSYHFLFQVDRRVIRRSQENKERSKIHL